MDQNKQIVDENNPFILKQSIMIYKRNGHSDDTLQHGYYLESHNAYQQNGKPVLREGKSIKGFIPRNLLYENQNIGAKKIIWYRKPQQGRVIFAPNIIKNKRQKIEGMIECPALVFMVKRRQLYVFAVKGRQATPNSKLYHAPFLNLYEKGNMCMGDSARRICVDHLDTYEDFIEGWERVFFESQFNHGVGRNSTQIKGCSVISYTQKLMKGARFDNDILKPMGEKNLKDLI